MKKINIRPNVQNTVVNEEIQKNPFLAKKVHCPLTQCKPTLNERLMHFQENNAFVS